MTLRKLLPSRPVWCLALALAALGPLPTANATAAAPAAGPVTLQQQAEHVEVAVHRGLRTAYRGRVADEDSPRACLAAVNAGADACEIDVRISRDGVPVVLHDPTTRRVTRGGRKCNLRVSTHTYRRLAVCRLNHGDRIARLTDLARAMRPYAGRKTLVVEMKGRAFTGTELARVNRYLGLYGFSGARRDLVYESYYRSNLVGLKHLATSVPAYLISNTAPTAAQVAAVPAIGGLDGLILPFARLVSAVAADPAYVAAFAADGMRLMPWLVNSPAAMRWVVAAGVGGFMTDNAATLRATVALRSSG